MKMKSLLSLALALSISGCSLLAVDSDGIILANRTEESLYYLAYELESSHLIDPIAFVSIESNPFARVPPGQSRIVEDIHGYSPGDDVRFFLYTEGEVEGVRAVKLTRVLTVHAEELRRGGRVEVDDF